MLQITDMLSISLIVVELGVGLGEIFSYDGLLFTGYLFNFFSEQVVPLFSYAEDLFHSRCYLISTSVFSAVIPVVCYSNADVDKLSILKSNIGKSGIYR
jgi:hypothetical protein